MKEKEKKKKVSKTQESSMTVVKGEEELQLNGDARDLAFEKYMFTDEDEDGNPTIELKEQRRVARNTSEKKRKDKIKLGIKKISSLLPEAFKDPKDNYVIMLDKTVNYIEELKTRNEQLLMGDRQSAQELEIQRLQKQVDLLQNQLRETQSLFQQFGPDFSLEIARAIGNWRGKENSGKKGLEKCLSAIMNSVQATSIMSESDAKKGKKNKNRCPTVSEHLTVSENNYGSDVETPSIPLMGGILPTLLPDGTLPPFVSGLSGFSPTGQPMGSGIGLLPGNAGFTNQHVQMLTSSGNIVFLSPNSAQQQQQDLANEMAAEEERQSQEGSMDITQHSFTEADPTATSTPAHNFIRKCDNDKKDTSLDLSDNPLLDPVLRTLSGNDPAPHTSSSGLLGNSQGISSSLMGMSSSNMSLPQFSQSLSMPLMRPSISGVSANQGTYVFQNGQLMLVNSSASMPLTSFPGMNTVNSPGLLATSTCAGTSVSSSLTVSTTPTPSTGIKMTATANPGSLSNLQGLQTQSVMINGQQQTVQIVPNQNAIPSQSGGSNQTVTINTPQGQLTMNTTPSQPNQLPSALILPTGQIVPVVTQPQMLFPQNQCMPVNGGLLMTGSQATQNASKPLVNQTMLGNSIRPIMGSQGTTTIRLPNGMLATVPTQQNNTIIRSQGNVNTLGVLGQPSIMVGQNGQFGNKVFMQPGSASQPMGQYIIGPNGQLIQQNLMSNNSLGMNTTGQIPVATSGDTVPTSTTTESKPSAATLTTGSTTTSAVTVSSALPQTVTAVLTADGNIIIMPVSNASVPATSTTATISQVKTSAKSKKARALKPKPSTSGSTATTETPSAVGNQTEATNETSTPLTISVSDPGGAASSTTPSSAQDILAKATASIFSTSCSDISPTMEGFYGHSQDDDNPLQIDTAQAPVSDDVDQISVTRSTKGKPRNAPRKRNDKAKKSGKAETKQSELLRADEHTNVNIFEQLAENDEDDGDINDFSDLIKMHDHSMEKHDTEAIRMEPETHGNETQEYESLKKTTPPKLSELPSMPILVPESPIAQSAARMKRPLVSKQDNSMNNILAMTSANSILSVVPPAETLPSVSQFSDLSFLCAVAEQHEQDKLPQPDSSEASTPANQMTASVAVTSTEQPPPETSSSGKKNKSSRKDKKKKDKKKKDKDRDRERDTEPPRLMLADGTPMDMSQLPFMSGLDSEKHAKPEKEKKRKKNKKKDKDRDASVAPAADTSGSTIEENTLGSLFSNMDQSISAPQFFDMEMTAAQTAQIPESLRNVSDSTENQVDSNHDTSLDESGKKKSKSKSKRSRSKKRKEEAELANQELQNIDINKALTEIQSNTREPLMTCSTTDPAMYAPEKKCGSSRRKQQMRPEDIIPEAISFTENDLCDVLDRVEGFSESLQGLSSSSKSKGKRPKEHISAKEEAAPPMKRPRRDSDADSHDSLIIIPSTKKAEERIPKEKLDEIFGPKTKSEMEQSRNEVMDVFQFDDLDAVKKSEKREKRKSKKSKKKNRDHAQENILHTMEIEQAENMKSLEERPPSEDRGFFGGSKTSESFPSSSHPKLIDSISNMMDSDIQDALPRSSPEPITCYNTLDTEMDQRLDSREEKENDSLLTDKNDAKTPAAARHSNIFSMAHHIVPPKYGPIVQPKTPKPAPPPANSSNAESPVRLQVNSCPRNMEESLPKTSIMEQRSKEHDLASSLPDELDIPDIVEENALRESKINEEKKLTEKQNQETTQANKSMSNQDRYRSETSNANSVIEQNSYSNSALFTPSTTQSEKDSRIVTRRESPGSNSVQVSSGSIGSNMPSTRETSTSRPLSTGHSNMFPPTTTSSSCALQGRQFDLPFPPPFPITAPSSRSSCSINAPSNEPPYYVPSSSITSSAYDSRHQFPPFYQSPFLSLGGHKGLPGAGPPPSLNSTPSSQMSPMDLPHYGGSSSSNMDTSKQTSMHSMDSRDKPLTHNIGNTAGSSSSSIRRDSSKSREREPSRHSSSLPPPPQLSHPDKNMQPSNSTNRLPTPTQNQSMTKSRSSSLGRSPQDQYMTPSTGSYPNQSPSGVSPGSSTLTSPPLHHPRPPSEPRGLSSQRPGYDSLMFPPGPGPASQLGSVPPFSVYDPPALHFTKDNANSMAASNSSYSQSRNSSSSNMSSKQSGAQGRSHTKSIAQHNKQASHHSSAAHQQPSHHASHQAAAAPLQSQNAPSQSKSSSRSKSKKSSGNASSSSTKQLQHYDMDSSGMFDPTRSMTPYHFPISNLSPQPRNLASDTPTYLPGNFFTNTGRQLSNANSLQHKDPSQINNPFQSFFQPPSRSTQNGIFQASPFGMNPHMHPSAANHSSPSQISQHSASMPPHMHQFNLTNLFPDMSNPSQSDISQMKFSSGNIAQGSSMDHNAMHHHQGAGSLYHNRGQVPPPMLHNVAFNSILGHQHGFDARGMGPGVNTGFGGPGHGPSFGMHHLNFPMHEH